MKKNSNYFFCAFVFVVALFVFSATTQTALAITANESCSPLGTGWMCKNLSKLRSGDAKSCKPNLCPTSNDSTYQCCPESVIAPILFGSENECIDYCISFGRSLGDYDVCIYKMCGRVEVPGRNRSKKACEAYGGTGDNLSCSLDKKTTTSASAGSTATSGGTSTGSPASSLVYTPMEEIPGQGRPTDFYEYVSALYKFGIGAVGIAALLMLTIGGFMYASSAGNTSSIGTAKKVITDAIVGLVLALTSYLLLYTINPDLVTLKRIAPISTMSTSLTGGAGSGTSSGSGACQPMPSGSCSIASLSNTCFGTNATQASAICRAESGGKTTLASDPDRCLPGREPVSFGLFQINITAHKIGNLDCPKAFDRMYTGLKKNPYCTIINRPLYDQCVLAAKKAEANIAVACKLSNNGLRWGQWGANSKCGFPR